MVRSFLDENKDLSEIDETLLDDLNTPGLLLKYMNFIMLLVKVIKKKRLNLIKPVSF